MKKLFFYIFVLLCFYFIASKIPSVRAIAVADSKPETVIAATSTTVVATSSVSKKNGELSVREIIQIKSEKYGLKTSMMDQIVKCESTYNPQAEHDGGKGKGVTGYHLATFNESLAMYRKQTGQNLNYNSSFDQIELMAWDYKTNPERRYLWSSYVRYSKYGTCEIAKIKQITKNNA